MQSNTRRGVIITLISAFLLERGLSPLSGPVWFVGVFLGVYVIARCCLRLSTSSAPAYFEDIFFGLAVCIGLGLFAWYADSQISIYTGKHGGPAVPAVIFALVDRFAAGDT